MSVLPIPGRFGEHYQLLTQGQSVFPGGMLVSTTDAALVFSIITQDLKIPPVQWRGLLVRMGIAIPPN